MRERDANQRASETDNEREERITSMRERVANLRNNETHSQAEQRRHSDRTRTASRRALESAEQAQRRRDINRINQNARSAARHTSHDCNRVAIDQFKRYLYIGPVNPCYCCSRLCYSNGGSYIRSGDSLLLPVHNRESSSTDCDMVWICSRCKPFLRKQKLPPFALVNNMLVSPIPPELDCLNNMEKRLISRVQPFMKLVVLPCGQCALKGQTINFPVNTSEICHLLPKTLDNAGVVLIAPPRAGRSEQAEIPDRQTYFTVKTPIIN